MCGGGWCPPWWPLVITVLSWVCVVLVLAAYAASRRHPAVFDAANVVLCVPVALPALMVGAYSSAAISLAFGVIGLCTLTKRRKNHVDDQS